MTIIYKLPPTKWINSRVIRPSFLLTFNYWKTPVRSRANYNELGPRFEVIRRTNRITESIEKTMNISDKPMVKSIEQETSVFLTKENTRIANNPMLPKLDFVLAGSTEISDFFKRPVEIANVTPAATSYIQPWVTWMGVPSVAAKMRNYKLIRGTMCLRFMVNAQPFWYGRYLAFMDYAWGQSQFTYTVNSSPWYTCYGSDYRVPLDLAVDQSVELRIPYMDKSPWMNTNAPVTSYVAISSMFGPLDAQTGSSVSPTIKVYAWVEDLELAVPVSQSSNTGGLNVAVSKLETMVPDEQRDGPISGPISSLAKTTALLKDIPVIGGAASTVSSIAHAASGVAALFGFSKPPDIRERHVIINKIAGDMATGSGIDVSNKLTMDIRHGKSINPMTVDGSTHDSLALGNIAGRPGLLSIYSGSCASPVGTRIAQIRNHPCHMIPYASNGWQTTPLGYASLPFNRWSGSLVYKISLICSRFHRGRLAIYWNSIVPTESVVSNLTNITFLEVGPGNECEVVVPYANADATLLVCPKDITSNTPDGLVDNGFLFIDVDQVLTCPSASANIGILVSVRAGPDFTLGIPTNSYLRYINDIPYQSTTLNTSLLDTSVPILAPNPGVWSFGVTQQADKTGNLKVTNSNLVDVNATNSEFVNTEVFGESFVSFRNLMKRYNYIGRVSINTAANEATAYILLRRTPPLPVWNNKVAGANMMQYLSRLFCFYSGSTRVKTFRYYGSYVGIVARGQWGTFGYGSTEVADKALNTLENIWIAPTLAGAALGSGNQVLEFEIPDSSGYRMLDCNRFASDAAGDAATVVTNIAPVNESNSMYTEIYYAAGDDFNFYLFRGVPIIWFNVPYTGV